MSEPMISVIEVVIAGPQGPPGEWSYKTPKTVTGEYTLTPADQGRPIFADATAAAFVINVPTAVGNTGPFMVRATATNGNAVTLVPVAGQGIDKESTLQLGTEAPDIAATLASDNSNWHTI